MIRAILEFVFVSCLFLVAFLIVGQFALRAFGIRIGEEEDRWN